MVCNGDTDYFQSKSMFPSPNSENLAIWAHFHAARPSADGITHHKWENPGVFLRWAQDDEETAGAASPRSAADAAARSISRVTFIIFDCPPNFVRRTISSLRTSGAWKRPAQQPIWLLAEFLRCWHQTVDEAAWSITGLANEVEQITFQEAAKLPDLYLDLTKESEKEKEKGKGKDPSSAAQLPLLKAHIVAKNGIYSLEALDSALKCVGKVVDYYKGIQSTSGSGSSPCGNRDDDEIRKSLAYTTELFQSTRYRIISVDNRMKNVINLVSIYFIFLLLPATLPFLYIKTIP